MQELTPQEKVAKILKLDKHSLMKVDERLQKVTGKTGMLEAIMKENEALIRERLLALGVPRDAKALEVYEALISKVEADDHSLFTALGNPNTTRIADCQRAADAAYKAVQPPKGYFLKFEKAWEFLMKEPPKKVLEFLGYDNVDKMLANEDLLEVYCALRFVEGSDWLNNVFFKQYEKLTPDDFEERPVEARALGEKWGAESQKFVAEKRHNISHLKELGVVFIIPVHLGISGELLRMVALVIHYLHEIPFYASIFKDRSSDRATFAQSVISLLRGDVVEERFSEGEKSRWLVVQRYLAKDDENDWRLFVPHINPEALHWYNTEEKLSHDGENATIFSSDFAFWHHLGWVGDYFLDETGVPILVSFNIVDTVMSLVKEKEMEKYLYHHEEALWNKIFVSYFGPGELERYSREYLLQGYFDI